MFLALTTKCACVVARDEFGSGHSITLNGYIRQKTYL